MKKYAVGMIILLAGAMLSASEIVLRPAQVTVGAEVTFQFEPPLVAGANYHWDFGDGGETDTANPEARHAFNEAGSFRVKCTAGLPGIAPDQAEVSVTVVETRRISPQGREFRQGKKVNFQAENFIANSVKWDFGDGTVESGPRTHGHVYQEAGNYTVGARDQNGDDRALFTCQVTIDRDSRTLEALPRLPQANEKVAFTAQNFSSNSLRWDFGDGKVSSGGASSSHYYRHAGSFQVRVWENADAPDTAIALSLTVAPDARRLQVAPATPRANQAVAFTAVGFPRPGLKWNFGDGKIENGGPKASHVYGSTGNFQVQVWVAEDGADSAVKTTVTVQPDVRQVVTGDAGDVFEGSDVDFEGRGFGSSSLKWDFGDGTVEPRGAVRQTHRFQRPGSFLVKVVEADSADLPVEKRIQVLNDNRSLELKDSTVFANSEFEIEARNFRASSIRWDFGDGPPQTGGKLARHRYARPGQFQVRAVDQAGRDGKTFEKTVVVTSDSRSISVPDSVIAGEAVAMKLLNVRAGSFTWKFSDGESRSGLEFRDKAFRSPGPQRISVSDASGQYPPLEKTIQVLPDTRSLKSSAAFILPGEEVTFTAANFKGPGVRWDFGDGTVTENGPKQGKHAFAALGRYQVKAVDFSGQSSKVFSTDIVVAEATPGFEVRSLEFVFDHGKYYRVIAKNSPGPAYSLRVKAKGRGVLSGQFILDGMSIGLFQLVIQENQTAVLPKAQLAALPTLDLGLHELTIKFGGLPVNLRIPILKYFVSAAGMVQIVAPPIDGKAPSGGSVRLRWEFDRPEPSYEIAVSDVPFQFLDDRQVEWRSVGDSPEYLLDAKPYKPGTWIYWQVRLLDAGKQVVTTSEIASFKLGG